MDIDPTVNDAKALAKKYGKDGIVIFHVSFANGTQGYASYGKSPALCATMARVADEMYNAAEKELKDE